MSSPAPPVHTSLLFGVIVTASAVQARVSVPATVVAVYWHRDSRGPCDGVERRLVGVGSLCGSARGGSHGIRGGTIGRGEPLQALGSRGTSQA